ncbi:PDZ domain-containing protein [Brochothrix campestris]|uniref:PDZ domain-containing protein n=1 Tax=Brochothrix campestris TaxID=2757 RepID=UPI0012EC292A|nr:PDZ domain-containing protein [Brochothrix campestris]
MSTFIVTNKRIKQERHLFNSRIYSGKMEWMRLLFVGLLIGISLSAIIWYTGVLVDFSWLFTLNLITLFMFVLLGYRGLSSAYTIGLATLVLIGLNFILLIAKSNDFLAFFSSGLMMQPRILNGLSVLLVLCLLVEVLLVYLVLRRPMQPSRVKIRRGTIQGQFKYRSALLLPLFMLLPVSEGGVLHATSWWPVFAVGNQSFIPIVVPVIIGMGARIRSDKPQRVLKKRVVAILALALMVALVSVAGYFYNWLTFTPFVVALLGHMGIDLYFWLEDDPDSDKYHLSPNGIRVMGTRDTSAARKMGIEPGEIITGCNGKSVYTRQDLYDAMNLNRAYVRLTVLDEFEEPRFVETALYEEDSFEMGLLFVEESVIEEMTESVKS